MKCIDGNLEWKSVVKFVLRTCYDIADQQIREMRLETNVFIAILISSGRNEAVRTVVRFFSTELMIRAIAFEY